MRRFAIVLVTTLAACAGDGAPGDPPVTPDAGPEPDGGDGELQPPARGFQIVSPKITIAPGVEETYCYFFRTPNKADLSITKWESRMAGGSHHVVLFLTQADQQTPGTVSTRQCGFINGGAGAVWTYSAASADHEVQLPLDDGTGVPLGQAVRAGQAAFLQIDVRNTTGESLDAYVVLNGHAHAEGAAVTPTSSYITYDNRIDLAPGSAANPTIDTAGGMCDVHPEQSGAIAKFWMVSTRTHKQGTYTLVKDGDSVVFDSTSWREPGQQAWDAPFFSFASGRLTYQCDYANPNNYRIEDGENAAKAEVCMAIGFYFPALTERGHYCLNSSWQY